MSLRRALPFILLLCAGCATAPPRAPVPPPDPHTQMSALENRIFELIQEERQKIDPKAKALALDSELVGVARQKSSDMADRNYMAHLSPDGSSSASIIMDQDASFQGLLGENIAAEHYLKDYGVDVETFARRFVDLWLASPVHRDNLSFAAYDRTGVGAAVNGDTVYVTELFATDMGLPPPPATAPAVKPNAASPEKSDGG
ncbi:MAG TPA: CAP domain-containing protein [Rhizomicrobium sp.]|jgi:uncharacterized protein YkwD